MKISPTLDKAVNDAFDAAIAKDPTQLGLGTGGRNCARCQTPVYRLWLGLTVSQTIIGVTSGFVLAVIVGLATGAVRL
jgi:hypothetical protein